MWLEAHDHKVEVLRDTRAPVNHGGIMPSLIETIHMKEADIAALGLAAGTQTERQTCRTSSYTGCCALAKAFKPCLFKH